MARQSTLAARGLGGFCVPLLWLLAGANPAGAQPGEEAIEWPAPLPACQRGEDADPVFAQIKQLVLPGQRALRDGRLAEAETALTRLLPLMECLYGPDHSSTLTIVGDLARVHEELGRYEQAEQLHLRALKTKEAKFGLGHKATITSISNLGTLYSEQGRYEEAEALYRGALARAPGGSRDLTVLHNLGVLHLEQDQLDQAEPLLKEALDGSRRTLGESDPETLVVKAALATLHTKRREYEQAERLHLEALRGRERILHRDHISVLNSLSNLATFYEKQRRFEEAEPLFLRALAGAQRVLGPEHPYTLLISENFLLLRLAAGEAALEPARLLVQGLRARRGRRSTREALRADRTGEGQKRIASFALLADAAWAAVAADGNQREALLPEVFAAVQEAMTSEADRALLQAAARRYADQAGGGLSGLVGEREALVQERVRLDADYAASFADTGSEFERVRGEVAARRAQVDARLDAIDAQLRSGFPAYFELVRPSAIDIAAAQRLLGPAEAILLAVPSRFGTHVVAVTAKEVRWARSGWDAERVGAAVRRLLDDAALKVPAAAGDRADGQGAAAPDGPPGFDRTTAHALYRELIVPVADMLGGTKRLYLAAGGALAALPFSILVAEPPQGADNDPAALRGTAWFADRQALVHIPSLQSLALLRGAGEAPPPVSGESGFRGFGDPLLYGEPARRERGLILAPDARALFRPGRTRGGRSVADISQLRGLPRLPGTAQELEAVRRVLKAPAASVTIGEAATETAVKGADLSGARLLLFSTHGLTTGEIAGVAEPGLVLTPPDEASEQDDGFLAASEVLGLRLDAEWVVLSACNTASGEGGQGLSSLARAFFHAGARNLLASHWPVSDEVAPVLTVRTVTLERAGMGRAEAFQQAMREVRMDPGRDTAERSWAHPFYWAPFVLIGGGR